MSAQPCTDNSERITTLRQELKAWEKTFAASHDGRKAGRDDIKANPEIGMRLLLVLVRTAYTDRYPAAKYREYDRLRRPPPPPASTPQKRKAAPVPPSHTPSKRLALTPQKPSFQPVPTPSRHLLASPSQHNELEPTPAHIRHMLGPTPQKDGQILSLFDVLSSAGTPSKPRTTLGPIDGNVTATPSKTDISGMFLQSPVATRDRGSRTPASSGKRFMLDAFLTPAKREREGDGDEALGRSPSARQLETPAFLRRSTVALGPEDGGRGRDPPFKKRGLVRSLSAIIRGLREQEEERMDDEMEALREMEEEEMEGFGSGGGKDLKKPDPPAPRVLVEDSQVEMPLGPDTLVEEDEDSDTAGGLDHNGQPRKVWKKKGLKRQTRRVIMRPVLHKAKPQVDGPASDSEDNDQVPETQGLHAANAIIENGESNSDDGSDYDDAQHAREVSPSAVKKAAKTAQAAKAVESKPGNVVQKAARKISATAHANYKKLKIKNKNSKANGRGRFGRR